MDLNRDFSLSPEHKVPPRKGRRAVFGNNASTSAFDDDIGSPDDLLDSPLSSSSPTKSLFGSKSPLRGQKSDSMVPPRSRKTGGWADESVTKSGKSRRGSTNIIEQERFQSPERNMKHDSDDDIPLIPDIEEIQDEEMLSQVAEAPSVTGKKVASLSELDSDLMKKSAFSTLDNINLSILTNNLQAEDDVKEPNVEWTWDLLFTEVASDLRSEWEGQGIISTAAK